LEQVSYVVCSNITKNLVNAVPEKNHSTLWDTYKAYEYILLGKLFF
jgi:hypothetical protein